jgi:acetolactate synthase-1/2/3 large subunit
VLGDVRYHDVAKGFGCYGERVARLEDIGPAIGRALDSGLPGCIDVTVDLAVVATGTEAMLGDGSPTEIMVPYYENIPLD